MLSSGGGYLAILLLVKLVAEADKWEGLRILRSRILIEAVTPAAESLRRLLVGDIVAEGAAISTTIESIAKRLELLLTGGIPDLKSNHIVVY